MSRIFQVRSLQFLWFAILAATTAPCLAAVQLPDPPPHVSEHEMAQGFSDHRILAMPRAGALRLAEAAEARERLSVHQQFERFGGLRVLKLDGLTPAEAIARLQATGHYEFVEPDYILSASVVPNDPRFAEQWSLNNTGAGGGIAGSDIKAPAAWDIRNSAPSVIVAVVDSGLRTTHQDIAANLWINPGEIAGNGIDDDGNGYIDDVNGINSILARGTVGSGNPADDSGHGSHVAGIIGAVGNNATGISGVAWSVKIMALKFLGSTGTGFLSNAIECIDYAIARGANIINASYGAQDPKNFSQSELEAIRRARDAGIVFVAAAGNNGLNMDISRAYPAGYPLENVVAVGSSTRLDDASTFSNFGSGAVELFAPGSEILSLGHTTDSAYVTLSGTSMAAPHVSGALALLKAQFPGDSYRGLINRLLRGVHVKPAFAGRAQTRGRLDLAAALATTTNRPFNDDFANRAVLIGNNFAARSSNSLGTRETGESVHAEANGGSSLWWSWTPAASATVTFDTSGSSFDTLLAVYTGSALNSLLLVAANDNFTGVTSRLPPLAVLAGTTYQIAVDGKAGATGLVLLNIGSVPLNDNFAGTQELSGESVLVKTTNANASREPGEPLILGNAGGRSLWYRWTAPSTKRYQISAFSLDVDTLAAIYTGSSLATLSLVTAGDNVGSQPSALCTLDASAGTTYYITIDAKDSLSGGITLSIVDSLWQFTTDGPITGSPAVAPDGTIYVGSIDNFLYAISPAGTQLWRYQTGGLIDTCSPAIGPDGTVYTGSTDGYVYALNPSGTLRWRFLTGSRVSNSPAIAADGTIYIKSDDAFLYALSPSGTQLWRFNTQGVTYASPVIAPDGTIYVGSGGNRFFAVNPNGTQKWSFTADGDIYATAAIDAAGNVYFGTLTGRLYSLTPAGVQRWTFMPGGPMSSSPSLSADGTTVYFGSYDRKLHAVNTSNGVARWAFDLGDEVRASSPLVAADGTIYIGCYDSRLQAVNTNGTLKRFYATGQRIRSSPVIVGTTLYVGSNDGKLYALPVGVGPGAGPWSVYRNNQQRTGRAVFDPGAISITQQPESQTMAAGSTLLLSVTTTGATPISYQWFKNGTAIAGATGSSFTIASTTPGDSGSYHVVVTGPAGPVTSATAVVFVAAPGRIINISARSPAGTDASTLIVGFVIVGQSPETLPVLIRASGPSLVQFGVTGTLADPRLTVFDGSTAIQNNDNWGGNPAIATTSARVGAFPFISNTSKDAALLSTLSARAYTVHITGADGGTGVTLAEVYDAAISAVPARLVNISARSNVGTGDNVLIAGFVIRDQPRPVLIRAVGPTLGTQFGVPGVLGDPKLELYSGQTKLRENDNWNVADAARFAQVGAFLLDAGSRDSVIVVQLAPGAYTAVVSGVGGTSGVALVEVYELP